MTDQNEQEPKLREGSLAFFGAITASISHELNNVISIIDQTGGLLGDLLAGTRHGRPMSEEQVQRIADKIGIQTERGIKFIKRLNTFAHSADEPVREFDLNQLMENLTALTERLATLKVVRQEVNYYEQPLVMTGNPFLIQQIIFLVIKELLGQSAKNDIIRIAITKSDNRGLIEITMPDKELRVPENLEYMKILAGVIDGTFEAGPEKGKNTYELFLTGVK